MTYTWAKIKDGIIVRMSTELPAFDDDTPRDEEKPDARQITEDNAAEKGWHQIADDEPPAFDSNKQSVEAVSVENVDGKPVAKWNLRDLTPDERAANAARSNGAIISKIVAIEARQARAVREHILGDGAAKDRLKTYDVQIAALRAQMK